MSNLERNKILVVTPCSTHPDYTGNGRRVRSLIEDLESLGYEVHCAYLRVHGVMANDVIEMRAHFGDRLHVLSTQEGQSRRGQWFRTMRSWFEPTIRYVLGIRQLGFADPDREYRGWWDIQLWFLTKKIKFGAVFIEYIFFSRAFQLFDGNVIKILDTHDVFAGRNERLAANGINVPWWSTTTEGEAAALNRADVVVAIQDEEAEYFRGISSRDVVSIPHVPPLVPASDPGPGREIILTVCSSTQINLEGILWFVKNVLSRVLLDHPNAQFHVVGSVCVHLSDLAAQVESMVLVGKVDSLDDAYSSADLIVNPVQFGTGLAIKSIEAMAFGKALVTTVAGARGLPAASDAYSVSENDEQMAKRISMLIACRGTRESMGEKALEALRNLKDDAMRTLSEVVSPSRTSRPRLSSQKVVSASAQGI